MLMLAYRSLRLALPVLVPLALGSLWTIAIMDGLEYSSTWPTAYSCRSLWERELNMG